MLGAYCGDMGLANASGAATVHTRRAGSVAGLQGSWTFDDASGTTASDTSQHGLAATLRGAPAWTVGKVGSALVLDGATQSVVTQKAVLDTSASFSVSAWVQLNSLNQFSTAVSQDGSNVSGFFLQYVGPGGGGDTGKFAFSLMAADDSSAASSRVTSPFSALQNVWYHLTGVYDAGAHTATLYVNGKLVASRAVPATWKATGILAIGRGRFGGNAADHFSGMVDEVQAYSIALSQQAVEALYAAAPIASPLRPPAVPLIVRSPYVSAWQPSDTAPGNWSTFWTGATRAMGGLVRVDGKTYAFFGNPGRNVGGIDLAQQTQLEMTATQSRYTFAAGPVNLSVNFLSPVDATDLRRFSAPLGYVYVQAQTTDGAQHAVQVYHGYLWRMGARRLVPAHQLAADHRRFDPGVVHPARKSGRPHRVLRCCRLGQCRLCDVWCGHDLPKRCGYRRAGPNGCPREAFGQRGRRYASRHQ